jgi:hypothetical protein
VENSWGQACVIDLFLFLKKLEINPDPTLISPQSSTAFVPSSGRGEAHSKSGLDPSTMLRVMVRYSNYEVLEGKKFPLMGIVSR